jgi:hypothetical protein
MGTEEKSNYQAINPKQYWSVFGNTTNPLLDALLDDFDYSMEELESTFFDSDDSDDSEGEN